MTLSTALRRSLEDAKVYYFKFLTSKILAINRDATSIILIKVETELDMYVYVLQFKITIK